MSKKSKRVLLYTKLLGAQVRLLLSPIHLADAGRTGKVVNVYLIPAGVRYTVCLKDGRLVETDGDGMVVER